MSGEIAPKDDPGDVDDEEPEHHPLDAGELADRQHHPHLMREEGGEEQRGQPEAGAARSVRAPRP